MEGDTFQPGLDKQQQHILSVGHSSYQNSRSPNHNVACMSMKLEPWTCSTSAEEQYRSFPAAGGGAWIPSPEIEGVEYQENAMAEGITHCEELCSQKARINPLLPKRLVLASRDKESLMEEIISLKKAILDQAQNFKQHKVQASTVELENRKLERDIEDLEMQGSKAPRTGGPSRLRAKLQGLKVMLENLQSTCEAQREELSYLHKDIRVTRTREVEVERDVFAEEILRLQRLVKRLKTVYSSLSCENKELCRTKDKTVQLEIGNQRLETCIAVVQKALNKKNQELSTYKHRARESFIAARKDAVKCKELQEQATFLEGQLQKERLARRNTDRQVSTLEGELEKLLFQLEDKEHCRTNMKSRGVHLQQIQNCCADRNCKQVANSNQSGKIRKARHLKGSQGKGEPTYEQMLTCHVDEFSQKKVVHGPLCSSVTVKRGVLIPKLKLELVKSIDLGNETSADIQENEGLNGCSMHNSPLSSSSMRLQEDVKQHYAEDE